MESKEKVNIMDNHKKKILLVDGNSIMFRAYYATSYTGNIMQTSTGIYTNALYGFINMLNKLKEQFEPEYILVAFDKGKQTFRHQALASYKGKRAHMPDELAMQIPLIKEVLDILKIKHLELDLYEADDIVGSMAKKAFQNNLYSILVSGDRDLLQLASIDTDVYLTKKGVSEFDVYTIDNFYDKMGFAVNQMVDYKAIIGDNSDNLPGVRGVGPKTAVSLLAKYQNIDGIYNHLDELTPKVQEAFLSSKETCYNTLFLAKIYQDIDFDFRIEDCQIQDYDQNELRSFYQKMEFTSFIKKMEIVHEDIDLNISYDYYLNDLKQLKECLTNGLNQDIYLDCELDQENYHKGNILGISILINNQVFFFNQDYEAINLLLNKEEHHFLFVDSKKVSVVFKRLGILINPKHIIFDTLVAIYLINPSFISNDFKTTIMHLAYNHYPCIKNLCYLEEIYGNKTKWQIPLIDVYAKYSMDKLIVVKEIQDNLVKELKDINLYDLFIQVELPLAYVLGQMEYDGFKIDQNRLSEIGISFNQKILALQEEIYSMIGKTFNISSPKQLGVILFDELMLAKGKKNKTGYSTSAEVLESLKGKHPVIEKILEYRKYTKLHSTYVTGLFEEIMEDGKVHTIFKQTLTSTGRLSSTEPNIQNIPIRDEDGKIIRSAFVPTSSQGYLVSADYSQIELRILAEMSNCQEMINDFNHGLDLHTSTASKVYGIKYSEVTKDMRRTAKAINFGLIYGMSDWGLADTLGIQPIDAKIFIEKYFAIYPEIKEYLNSLIQKAKDKGYSETMFHRRRYIPELTSSNFALKGFGERTSMNAPIQGSAADIIKMAMVKLFNRIENLSLTSRMIAQVHDEIIIDTTKEELETIKQIIKEEMENVYPEMKVKLVVDVEYGTTWDLK